MPFTLKSPSLNRQTSWLSNPWSKQNFALILLLLSLLAPTSKAITKVSLVDHDDPNYFDRCLEITGELCDYCCLVDFEWCSRDIYNCEPTQQRDLGKLVDLLACLAFIICGFPLVTACLYYCLMMRFCVRWYPHTSGTTIFECLWGTFMLCCCRKFTQTYPNRQDEVAEGGHSTHEESKGCLCKLFCCCRGSRKMQY